MTDLDGRASTEPAPPRPARRFPRLRRPGNPLRLLRPEWRRPVVAAVAVAGVIGGVLVTATVTWTRMRSAGRIHSVAQAPAAPVAIVFGSELAPGGTRPKPFLAGRLDATARLYTAGRVRAVLVSGDGGGDSGNEVAAMRAYLVERGVPAARIASDPYGLDTYDTCTRALRTYGVRRALLVTQTYHLPRAVTLCRVAGVDAYGAGARCDGCWWPNLVGRTAREALATVKAAGDALRRRPPAVVTPPDPALSAPLRG